MKNFVAVILVLYSVVSFAVDWKRVTGQNGIDLATVGRIAGWIPPTNPYYQYYVGNIRTQNGLVYYWSLTNYPERARRGWYSYVGKWKVDCADEYMTPIHHSWHSQRDGKGRTVDDHYPGDNWFYPLPADGPTYEIMKFACKLAGK